MNVLFARDLRIDNANVCKQLKCLSMLAWSFDLSLLITINIMNVESSQINHFLQLFRPGRDAVKQMFKTNLNIQNKHDVMSQQPLEPSVCSLSNGMAFEI